ncbi:MAG TPA: hypothetical protein VKU02_21665, partial [Gemmataceae bacterium]|nr:hypothetical protein [Gemmataceae bacterium]
MLQALDEGVRTVFDAGEFRGQRGGQVRQARENCTIFQSFKQQTGPPARGFPMLRGGGERNWSLRWSSEDAAEHGD